MAQKLNGAHAFMQALIQEGVETIFGYPGGAIMPVFDALYDYSDKVNHILTRHEQGATHAAQGYARVSGKVGVALVTSGPAATNAITGVADALLDSTPLIVVTGQVGAALLARMLFRKLMWSVSHNRLQNGHTRSEKLKMLPGLWHAHFTLPEAVDRVR